MTPEEYLHTAGERLFADGSEVMTVELPMGKALVGYQSEFRIRWVFTKLHLFIIVAAVPVATQGDLQNLVGQATKLALDSKGKRRGLQVGVAVAPVLISPEVTHDAVQAVGRRPPRAHAFFMRPQIVDLDSGRVHRYEGRVSWGFFYTGWISSRLAALPQPGVTDR